MSTHLIAFATNIIGNLYRIDDYEILIKMIIDNEIIILALIEQPVSLQRNLPDNQMNWWHNLNSQRNKSNSQESNLLTVNQLNKDIITPIIANTINYEHIFKLLKTNTSIKTIKFDYSYYYYRNEQNIKWYKLLCETLEVNTSLNTFWLSISTMIIEDLDGLNEILKINSSTFLKNVHIECNMICSDTWIKITDMLKTNNFVETVNINVMNIDVTNECVEKQLTELLLCNKSLNKIVIYGLHNTICYKSIIDALDYNTSIIEMYFSNYVGLANLQKIREICERNKHNIRLKNLIIQDLKTNYNSHYHNVLRSFVYS